MLTILTGNNTYLLKTELRRLVDAFLAEHGDMGLERLDGEDASYERMQEALQSLPFLASKKMVVLQAPGSNKQFAENAEKLFKELPETTDAVIVESKLDKRLAYYKLLKKQQGFQEFNELDENGLARWLMNQAKDAHATISSNDARYLVQRVGTNQLNLANELEKLSLYDPAITRATIDELTVATPQSTIFELLEAAFVGNTKRALELYNEQRALKVEPQQIIAMLAWQLHILALIKAAGQGRRPDEIAKAAKLNPYVVQRSASVARRLTMAQTKRLVSDLTTIDERLKRESLNADEVLLEYLFTLYSSAK